MNKELQNEIINYKRKIYNTKGWPTLNNNLKRQIIYYYKKDNWIPYPLDAEFNYNIKIMVLRMIIGVGGLRDSFK